MNTRLTRRSFLKRTALTAGALSATRIFPGPNLLAATGTIDKLNCVHIGCGGRGISAHISEAIGKHGQNLYAIVDPDENKHKAVRGWMKGKGLDFEKV
ncbi:MAG TPA: twin-arginine translocation signal domain-containing protein, partial [Verrucomicrobiae bacterium]|nr:twin-arginine translocation signal domain-containing protein [Verrucomicrobiae bacterium]